MVRMRAGIMVMRQPMRQPGRRVDQGDDRHQASHRDPRGDT